VLDRSDYQLVSVRGWEYWRDDRKRWDRGHTR
jgi:hypothetical protein